MENNHVAGKHIVRKLQHQEPIPYDLLLLADETIETIDRYIFKADIYVIEKEGSPIAAYVLYRLNADETEIKNIAVEVEYQGKGIGKLLLKDAILKAGLQGYKAVIIGTADAAIKPLYIYQKAGFEIFDIKKNFFTENYPEPIIENGIQLKHMLMLRKII